MIVHRHQKYSGMRDKCLPKRYNNIDTWYIHIIQPNIDEDEATSRWCVTPSASRQFKTTTTVKAST